MTEWDPSRLQSTNDAISRHKWGYDEERSIWSHNGNRPRRAERETRWAATRKRNVLSNSRNSRNTRP